MNRPLFPLALLAACGSCFAQGHLIGIDSGYLIEFNPNNGNFTLLAPITTTGGSPGIMAALAYDPATDTLFLSSSSSDTLWKLDYRTAVATLIGHFNVGSVTMHGLEWDSGNGKLYGYSSGVTGGGRFFEINPATAAATLISNPGFGGGGSLGYVPSTDTMYFADAAAAGNKLYTIDVHTGAVTLIGSMGTTSHVGSALAYNPVHGMIAADNIDDGLYSINLATGQATFLADTQAENLLSLAFVPTLTPPCYGNCDFSTVPPILNVNDFTCFLNRYATSRYFANCDQSTTPPILNVNDFTCFLNKFAAGCP